jgi:hypothetical protein
VSKAGMHARINDNWNDVAIWIRKWQLGFNESTSVYIDFTNKIKQQPIFINGTKVQYANTAKYLGMTLDVVVVERAY